MKYPFLLLQMWPKEERKVLEVLNNSTYFEVYQKAKEWSEKIDGKVHIARLKDDVLSEKCSGLLDD